MSDNKKHHKWSPSRWPAFKHCPHYTSSDETSEAATRGTLQHEALEALGTHNNERFNELRLVLSADELENVKYVYGYCQDLMRPDGGESMWEQKVVAIGADFLSAIPGTADFTRVHDDKVVIVDAKFGVVKEYDPQLEVYALGAMQKFGVSECEYHIVYGREKTFTTGSVNKDDYLPTFNKQIEILKQVESGEKLDRNTNDFCAYCENNKNCPAINGKVTAMKKYKGPMSDELDATNLLKGITKKTNLESVDIDILTNFHTYLKGLTKLEDTVKKVLKKRLIDGEEATLVKISSTAGRLGIDDNVSLFNQITEKAKERGVDFTPEQMIDLGTFSLSKVRGLLYGEKSETKANKADFEEQFADCLTRGAPSSQIKKRSKKELEEMKLLTEKGESNES